MEFPTVRAAGVIAVIDDDPATVAWATDLLTEAGHRVITAASRNAAYDLLRHDRPDVILLDLHMEHAQAGWVLLDLIGATPALASIPVVVWSADTATLRAKSRRIAASGGRWLAKPCDGQDLLAAIQAARSPMAAAPSPAPLERVAGASRPWRG